MAGPPTTAATPVLIGLDWGTTSLRAYLFAADGSVIAQRSAPKGVLSVADRDFAAAREAVIGDWHAASSGALPVIASGMIGSTVGWREVPYVACPAGFGELAAGLREQARGPAPDGIVIVPGLNLVGAGVVPDVMRGEETQVLGALERHPDLARGCRLVLPGTHSKWVAVEDGRIARFETYMTGELYAALSEHSILGRPARTAPTRDDTGPGFERGVAAAMGGSGTGLAPRLFSARTRVLANELAPAASLAYLSGLLIGDEIRSALTEPGRPDGHPLGLIGVLAIVTLYRRALALFDIGDALVIEGAASAGLWRLAVAAGLVSAAAT